MTPRQPWATTPGSQFSGRPYPRTTAASIKGHSSFWLTLASYGYLAFVVALLVLLFGISERWWLGALVTYLPRSPWAIPALLLLAVSVVSNRSLIWCNLISLLLVLVPIMELRTNWTSTKTSSPTIRIVTANVENFARRFPKLLSEIQGLKPDIVLLQEAQHPPESLDQAFAGWHVLRKDAYWIASRWPLEWKANCRSDSFDRISGMVAVTETPEGPLLLANIHLMTFRKGADEWTLRAALSGELFGGLASHTTLREIEAAEVRQQLEIVRGNLPLVVGGDFNAPSSSHLIWQNWGDLQNAFDTTGFGYGYTSPCKKQGPWPERTPWARIDHILVSQSLRVLETQVGAGLGSDHCLVTARIVLPSERAIDAEPPARQETTQTLLK